MPYGPWPPEVFFGGHHHRSVLMKSISKQKSPLTGSFRRSWKSKKMLTPQAYLETSQACKSTYVKYPQPLNTMTSTIYFPKRLLQGRNVTLLAHVAMSSGFRLRPFAVRLSPTNITPALHVLGIFPFTNGLTEFVSLRHALV